MTRPPPRSTRTAPLFPTTTLFRSTAAADPLIPIEAENKRLNLRKACHFPPCSTRRICLAAEFSELCLPWFMGVERTHELVLGTHEVDNGGVVHGVIAALKRDLLVVRGEGFHSLIRLFLCAAQGETAAVEGGHVAGQQLLRVPLRIDGDDKRRDLLGVGTEILHQARQLEERRRADVRAATGRASGGEKVCP